MTPTRMAQLHRAAFTDQRPWSVAEFEALLSGGYVRLYHTDRGFALARTVAGESELLTVVVDPMHHRLGSGRALCLEWLRDASDAATTAFLEVAADNLAALNLYTSLGFAHAGTRKAYYLRKNAPSVDAHLMQLNLTLGKQRDSAPSA